jgi:hypothetical protein
MSDLSPETRDLLSRGRHSAMPAKSRAMLKRRVLAQVAAGSVVTTTATAAARLAVTKFVGVASVIAVVGAGAAVVTTREIPPAPQVTEAAPPVAVAARAAAPLPTPVALPTPTAPAASAKAPVARAVPPAPAPPRPAATPAPTQTPAPVAMSAAPPAVSTPAQPQIPAPIALPPPAPIADAPASPRRPSLEEDARLLREAHAALAAGDASGALKLLDTHAARFPASALEPERSAERVFALCLAGRADDARSAAGAFLRAHPEGPLARRVRASCGGR